MRAIRCRPLGVRRKSTADLEFDLDAGLYDAFIRDFLAVRGVPRARPGHEPATMARLARTQQDGACFPVFVLWGHAERNAA
jgi:hypothetical protein